MAILTPLCELLGIEHPVLLAPMAGVSGGALAAAVIGNDQVISVSAANT